MRIVDLLSDKAIELNLNIKDKGSAVEKLIELQDKAGNLYDKDEYRKGILEREESGSTAVGQGIAIPHCKSSAVKNPGLSAITVPNGVDYGALDGEPSRLLFMIAAPLNGDLHLEVLSRLMVILMDEDLCRKLINAKTKADFIRAIDNKESEKFSEEEKTIPVHPKKAAYRILAVTACPTGIAHTYMAAEALEAAGREMGYPLKAETNGSGGAKNVLTKEEIESADGIIIAADKTVDMARFDGKPLISVKVSEGIHKPEELISKIVNKEAPVYHHTGEKNSSDIAENESVLRQLYKHLMNGVSHMLPFVVAGGIFIAIAFLIDTVAGVPQNETFGTNTPASAFLKSIGGYAFNFMLPILSGYIAMSIADRPGLLPGFVGGYLASSGSTFSNPAGDVPSGFLGALLAGFIAGCGMIIVKKICNVLPDSLEGIKPVLIYPLLGLGIISVIMCAINPFMGAINTGLNSFLASLSSGSKIALGAVLGAMMSIDMGGPFNKAAYLFGTGSLAQATILSASSADPMTASAINSCYEIMAAVMIGGMIPPLAIALCTTFFKNRFTPQEQKSGIVNYVMGLSFITEGAIPYAASDPLRVIPSCMLGSAAAGALSMLFGCTLSAPHGGIFVFAVVGNWLFYLLALGVGSVIGMFLMALLKRPLDRKS